MWKIEKSTHGDYNHGRNSLHLTNFGNSRYSGSTVVWVLYNEHFPLDEDGLIAVYRKKDAVAMAAFFNDEGWDGKVGCPLMYFQQHLRKIKDWDTLDKIKEA